MLNSLSKFINLTLFRYAIVGGGVALIDVVFFYVFADIYGFNYLWLNAIGFILGTLINYLLSIRFVFKSGIRFHFSKEIIVIFLISIIGLILNQVIIFCLIEFAGIELMLSKLLTVGSVFSWNYLARKYFVFSE